MRHRSPWAGVVLALLAATSFAINSTSAGLAYAAGSNAVTVLAFRVAFGVIALYAVLRLLGVPTRLPPRDRWRAFGLGVLLGAYSYGLFGSFEHIPVALGVITFYTFPLMTALTLWLLGWERFTWTAAGALVLAFGGLALALDVTGEGIDAVGVAHGLFAAVAFTALLLLSRRVVDHPDSRPVTLHMLVTAVVIFAAAVVVTGDFALPQTGKGWVGFFAVPMFYTFSIVAFFVAAGWVGPMRVALTMNWEPVSSAILGALVLDQVLSVSQFVGVGLVIAGIVIIQLRRAEPVAPSAGD